MNVTSLDKMVRNILLRKGYSLHWYMQALLAGKDVLRELTFDDLQVINTKILTVNSVNAVDLPSDYVDYVSLNVMAGQKLRPLVYEESINPLYNYDTTFTPQLYSQNITEQNDPVFYYNILSPIFWYMNSFNEYGEFTGRFFGFGAGNQTDTFKVIKERQQIQLNEHIQVNTVVLSYISNGQNVDAASTIDAYAQATIEAYIMWQMKEQNRTYSEGEKERAKEEYLGQRKILRARMANLDLNVLKRIVQKNRVQSPK